MAIIPQTNLFSWKEIESLGDLERLRLVLEHLPDETLMQRLEKYRDKGRDDYPIRPVWNSIIAGIIYQHPSIESLRRELQRNAQLRDLCGFDPVRKMRATPPSSVYTRFLKLLLKNPDEIELIFEKLVDLLRELLPSFGRMLAMDGKAIPTYARKRKERVMEPDGRRDTEADTGVKTYKGKHEDGTVWEKTKYWFGYKLHLIIDAKYELPIGFDVTPASKSEHPEGKKLIKSLKKRHPKLIEGCEALMADRGYDSADMNSILWDDYKIKPVIDIRNMWKDGEETKELKGIRNLVYDFRGNIYCYCMRTLERRRMAYGGFEKDRETLKYRCPARHYNFE